jgi:LemA protein
VSKGSIGCGVIVGIAILLLATGVGSYNRLVELDAGVDSAWTRVLGAYERRDDLASSIMEAATGAEGLEREALTEVLEARVKVGQLSFESAPDAQQLAEFEAAQARLASALARVLVVVERNPELDAAESQIALERQRFNDATLAYDRTRRRVPTILLAGVAGFTDKPYFELAPAR